MEKEEIARDKPYWVAFNVFGGVGTGKFQILRECFGSGRAAWEGDRGALAGVLGVALWEKFRDFRKKFNPERYYQEITGGRAESDSVSLSGRNVKRSSFSRYIKVITLPEEDYPRLLREIEDPPPVLYVLGDKKVLQRPQIAVVGTRKMTDYGAQVTREIVAGLVDAGLVVTSGLACGVDTVAHRTALTEGGETVAVLGCGVDMCYPAEHQEVYNAIIGLSESHSVPFFEDVRVKSSTGLGGRGQYSLRENLGVPLSDEERKSPKFSIPLKKAPSRLSDQNTPRGAVVAEVPPGTRTNRGRFVERNRIISGLSLGVLVVEGARKSGTLITAGYGAAQGREVFAVPGPITSKLSVGPNMLIKDGAKAVIGVEDILEEIRYIRGFGNIGGRQV